MEDEVLALALAMVLLVVAFRAAVVDTAVVRVTVAVVFSCTVEAGAGFGRALVAAVAVGVLSEALVFLLAPSTDFFAAFAGFSFTSDGASPFSSSFW